MTNFCLKSLSRDQEGGGLRLGSKEEGPKCVCLVGGGGGAVFASLVGDKILNFGQKSNVLTS